MLAADDFAILKELKKDSTLYTREIAKNTKLSHATVNRRLHRLEDDGVIKKFTIEIDWEKIGRPMLAYVLINIDYPDVKKKKLSQDTVAERLIKHPYVQDCVTVTGRKDLIIKVRVHDNKELNRFINFLRGFEGVQMTETMPVLFEAPNHDNPFDQAYF